MEKTQLEQEKFMCRMAYLDGRLHGTLVGSLLTGMIVILISLLTR